MTFQEKKELIDKLKDTQSLEKEEWVSIIKERDDEIAQYLFKEARAVADKYYGRQVFLRGLIEFTNICKNDCYYCGIRRSNSNCERYRLTDEQILQCCEVGYSIGYKTFVLQGGEDGMNTADRISNLIRMIKSKYPDVALTLSIGERTKEEYQQWYDAGADRYLLRHETASDEHYRKLHPESLSLANRKQCLYNLKEIGYQIGTGFMVGSPYQTENEIAEDFLFIKELQPHMLGIGPFIPHHDTQFKDEPAGTLELTLFCIGLLRLMMPQALIPATTALGTIAPNGRELGIQAGANVIMPNLSPVETREKYLLYDNKICLGEEAATCVGCLKRRVESIGFEVAESRGDHVSFKSDTSSVS